MASTRRNGQLSSCEPCRKSKLRCDHMSPFCGRCYRRGLQDQCIYHPAPLTRPDLRQPSRKRQEKANKDEPLNTSFNAENENWTQKKASVSTPGFLGHTSYSDAFTDTTRSGTPLNTQRERREIESISDRSTLDFEGVAFVDSKRVQLGAQVLVLLEDLPFYRKVVTARLKIWEGWCLGWPVTEMLFDTVEKMWYSAEVETEDPKLRALTLSRRIFQSYTRPFDVNKTLSWSEFSSSTSGRWETVGLVFCLTGLATEWLSKEDPLFKQPGSLDPESLATTASTVCDICLQLCDSVGIINDIVTWLLLHHTILLAVVYGEGGWLSKKPSSLSSKITDYATRLSTVEKAWRALYSSFCPGTPSRLKLPGTVFSF
ncbi:hypothetical protein N7520_001022 [Penicillium odoratum]|uniref:uncharacterized protein n=1 Tax=Penicillium odoratum TaxID=1167516 RepID=UPI002547E929|nr:uncharacterized protein N7520_001022 [Penicillium odoratum]KAJ5777776.1 hypothetical protein N7520_001022 [Penicillium odoratum]